MNPLPQPEPAAVPPRRRLGSRPIGWQQPLSQELFLDGLARERRRADRFEEAFAVLLISGNRDASGSQFTRLAEFVSQPEIDADVIGWFEEGKVLGVIRSLADRDPREAARTLSRAVERELVSSLAGDRGDCSMSLAVYSPNGHSLPSPLFQPREENRSAREKTRDLAKRAIDIVGSLLFMVVFSPVFFCAAALIKITSKGPVFFRQQRIGKLGRTFTMLKFRTMQVNADPSVHVQYVDRFIRAGDGPGSSPNVIHKMVDDSRVTKGGHFLRKSSIDEFPQFWNVLKGEMSLVGPRPPIAYEVARYKRWHLRRILEVKPGITGLWQVNGRSRTTFDEMVRLDIQYARTHTLWLDLKILLATPRAVLSGKGAH